MMNARWLFVLLVIGVALAFSVKFRRIGIALSAGLAVILVWFNFNSNQTISALTTPVQSSSSSARTIVNFPVDKLQLEDLKLSGSGAPWQLSGKARNISDDLTISLFTVRVARYDCATNDTALSDCTLSWQGEPTLHVRLAPRQTQIFSEAIWSHDSANRISGVERLEFTLLNVQGSALQSQSRTSEQ